MKIKQKISISKILMAIGALSIIVYGILIATKIIENKIYGWNTPWTILIPIGIFYILIPLSTIPGTWSRIWAIFLTTISVTIIVGYFIHTEINYQSFWTYINPLPHIIMCIGAISWIIQG